jgi:hypothetical protein
MSEKKQPSLTDQALTSVQEAIGSSDPAEAIFSNNDTLDLLGYVWSNDPATWGRIRANLKGLVTLGDLDRAAKANWRKQHDGAGPREKLIERDGAYWKKRFTLDGPVVEPIANFVIHLRERLVLPSGDEVLAVDIRFGSGDSRRLDIPHDALLRKDDLLRRIGTTEATWHGNDSDVQLLRAHLLKQNAPRKDAVAVVGRHAHADKDYIALPGLILDYEGPAGNPPMRLVDTHGNPIVAQLTQDGRREIKWPNPEAHCEAARAVFRHLPQINTAQTVVSVIGWIFALPWASLIKRVGAWGGFPHLSLWGGTGIGKTSTVRTVLRVVGFPDDVTPLDLPGTLFTRLRAYDGSNLFPVFFDEFRLSTWERNERSQFLGELRQAYGGGREERGRPDQSATVYHLVSPIILAGEDRPRDLALENRLISIQLRKSDKKEEPFRLLSKAHLDAFALPYLSWCLAQESWLEDLAAHRTSVRELLRAESFPSADSRVVNNLAIVRFGHAMFQNYANHLAIEPAPLLDGTIEDALVEAARLVMPTSKDRNSLDQLMGLLWTMAGNGRLRRGMHYAFKGENLVIPLTEALAEARKYARETSWEEEVLSEDTYRGLINELVAGRGSYVLHGSKRADFTPDLSRRQRRGLLIDPHKLEQDLDLNAGQWGDATAILAIETPKRGAA